MEDGEGGRWLGHVLTPPLVEAAIMVLTDMGLALLSVVANLMVINSLREKEALLGVKQNLVRDQRWILSFTKTSLKEYVLSLTAFII